MENMWSYSEPQVLLGYLAHAHAIGTRPLFPLLRSLGTRLGRTKPYNTNVYHT